MTAKSFFERQYARVYHKYHWLRNRWPVWKFLNREARARYRADRDRDLSPVQQRILDELKENGIVSISITELIDEERWRELDGYIQGLVDTPRVQERIDTPRTGPTEKGDKYYNINLAEEPSLDLDSPLVQFNLSDEVLKIANAYMEMHVKFRGYRVWASLPVPAGAKEHASQRWHRDSEDRKMVKAFIYFSDVDEDTGPFTYVKESHAHGRLNDLFPQLFPFGYYPPDGAVEKAVPSKNIWRATGPKGTLTFCDTSGLHKGGYCKKKIRLMTQSVYGSEASKDPLNYVYPHDFDSSGLSPRASFAVANEIAPTSSSPSKSPARRAERVV